MNEEKLTEEDRLWKSCLSNEKGAWDKLYECYYRLIWSVVYKEIRDYYRWDKEEANQEAWEKVKKNLWRWEHRAKLSTYIYRIARNAVIDYKRRHERLIRRERGEQRPTSKDEKEQGAPIEHGDNKTGPGVLEGKIHFDEILAQLSSDDAYLIKALFMDDQSPQEVAHTLHVEPNALYQRIRRLLLKMRKFL